MKTGRIAAAVALLSLTGCFTISYTTNRPGGGQYREERGDFFFWGLAGDKTVQLKELCPEGVSRWKSQQTFVDGLLGFITLGIYIPRHITVECAGGKAYQLETDWAGQRISAVAPAPHAG